MDNISLLGRVPLPQNGKGLAFGLGALGSRLPMGRQGYGTGSGLAAAARI